MVFVGNGPRFIVTGESLESSPGHWKAYQAALEQLRVEPMVPDHAKTVQH